MTEVLDRRQTILDRVVELLGNLTIPLLGGENGASSIVPGNIVHNRNELPEDKVPGIIVLDADETMDQTKRVRDSGMVQAHMPAQIMKMTPEIYVVLDVRKPQNKNVGEDLNTARIAVLSTIMRDSTLQTVCGVNGGITYDGCVTDLARNRTMAGQLGLSITFMYPLLPREISGV